MLPRGKALARMLASRILEALYASDRRPAEALWIKHWTPSPLRAKRERAVLEGIRKIVPGLECRDYLFALENAEGVPFVYESPDAPQLKSLRKAFDLDKVASGPGGEYASMLRLAEWLGSRWDHGTDEVPGGNGAGMDLVAVVRAGADGKKYWCEIAAKVGVLAFASLGWPARLATISRDGYTWEHAIIEVWSADHSKWVALDTDFNVVFEAGGIPQSAYELCHQGPELRAAGRLQARLLGPPKPSLPLVDLLPFYAYLHIDLRTDWHTRRLRSGSPAGGDRSTWWTARPDFPRLITAKVRMDPRERFDWPVNRAWVLLEKVEPLASARHRIEASVCAYAPHSRRVEISVDGGEWREAGERLVLELASGEHTLSTRVISAAGWTERAETVSIRLPVAKGSGP